MFKGTNQINQIYKGNTLISKVYKGDTLIYPSGVEPNVFEDATVAFSLMDLELGATHVVRVRRSTDNVEQDFTASQITDGSLTTFCGAGDGFVSIWYNQKGGANATQTTATKQPNLVTAGTLNTLFGRPQIRATGSEDLFIDLALSSDTHLYSVNQSQGFNILISFIDSNFNLAGNQGSSDSQINNNIVISQFKNSVSYSPSDRNQVYNDFLNGALYTGIGNYSNMTGFSIGYPASSIVRMYNMSELIIYTATPASSRNQIETNINNRYAIY